MTPVAWVTLKQTQHRWEADLIAGILTAHDIPVQVLDGRGFTGLSGESGSVTVLVPASARWLSWLLIAPIQNDVTDPPES
jgi:hypothetical protein